jgi:dTDP-4-amino-4,6-dideoxygalactose transaminase
MVGATFEFFGRVNSVRIPFNKPFVSQQARRYMLESLDSGHQSGDGPFTKAATEELLRLIPARNALLTTSCTHALEMAAILIDLKPGDEVILPSFNFVSAANAIVLRGATPVFVDIDPSTLNIDASQVAEAITDRTKAVLVLHYAGVAADIEAIKAAIGGSGQRIEIIEDNAHGLSASWQGQPLGTFGAFSTSSFHETKNLQIGEGGALFINSDDPKFMERAEIIREKGTNRSRFFRGQVDKYTWVDIGSSWLPSDVSAAFLLGQIEAFSDTQKRRKEIWNAYQEQLGPWAELHGHRQPNIPPGADHPAHIYYLLLAEHIKQADFIESMSARDVHVTFHYRPLHLSTMGRQVSRTVGELPISVDVSDRLVRLPIWPDMSDSQVAQVIDAVTQQ